MGRKHQGGAGVNISQSIVTVDLAERSYRILVGNGTASAPDFLHSHLEGKTCMVVTDSEVALLHLEHTMELLRKCGPAKLESFIFPAGEESKHIGTILDICRACAKAGLDRKSILIALGGGVTGDMTGFAAAVYMRGIPFIQIPTTLLAMVDSSVGGKTGVDIPEGKNMIGAFHQPRAVWINMEYLSTLPQKQYLCGLAEIIKTAAILDADLFALIEQNIPLIRKMDPEFTARMVKRCCELKAGVVSKDEKEGSLRAILNYGHTFGHAVESSSGYTMPHGEAVALGMCMASSLAEELGIMSGKEAERQRALIRACALPCSASFDAETVYQALFKDKKTIGGKLRFVVTPENGVSKIIHAENEAAREIVEKYAHAGT